jgi:hypothetical protein
MSSTLAMLSRASLACVAPALALMLASCSDAPEREPLGTASDALFANDKKSFDYFVSKGLTAFQAAGIVGNLDQESGDSPTAVQPGGPGRGLAQWSAGGRWDTDSGDNATAYASSHGMSVWSLDLQLDFIWYELTTFSGYGLAALKATTNVTDAVKVFQNKFEGCGTCVETQRITYAKAVLAAYGAPPPYAAAFVGQSFPLASTTMTMNEGEVVPSYIELKNVGSKSWDSKTFLATTQPRDRKSPFADASWVSEDRLAGVVGSVPPGGTYKFEFNLAAPSKAGTYDEFFGVVQEGVAWFSDPGQGGPPDGNLEVKIQVVTPKYRGLFKAQSFPVAPAAWTVHRGDVAKGWIELTNAGTATWKAGVTKLATIPRDVDSPFAASSWLSKTRISSVAADVAPGAVGRFEVALDGTTVGDSTVKFGLVEEGEVWFADPGQGGPADGSLAAHFVVVPPDAPLDAGTTEDAGSLAADGGDGGLDPAADADLTGSASCNATHGRSRDGAWIGAALAALLLAVRSRSTSRG